MDEVTTVKLKPQFVLGTKKAGSYKEIPQLLCKLFEYAQENKVDCAGAPVFVCHEISIEEVCEAEKSKSAQLEVCLPLAKKVAGSKDFPCYKLAGGEFAKILHKGPYEDCGPAYQKLYAQIAAQGKKVTGPVREVYLNDPREVKKEEILTEIYAPIG